MKITPEEIRQLQVNEKFRQLEESKRRDLERKRHAWESIKDVSVPLVRTLDKIVEYAKANMSEREMPVPYVAYNGHELGLTTQELTSYQREAVEQLVLHGLVKAGFRVYRDFEGSDVISWGTEEEVPTVDRMDRDGRYKQKLHLLTLKDLERPTFEE